eukprot:6199238-Pleurochrysis_carterae.AAC.4
MGKQRARCQLRIKCKWEEGGSGPTTGTQQKTNAEKVLRRMAKGDGAQKESCKVACGGPGRAAAGRPGFEDIRRRCSRSGKEPEEKWESKLEEQGA